MKEQTVLLLCLAAIASALNILCWRRMNLAPLRQFLIRLPVVAMALRLINGRPGNGHSLSLAQRGRYIHDCVACRFISHIDRCMDRSAFGLRYGPLVLPGRNQERRNYIPAVWASPCCSLGSRLVLLRKLLIFGCHLEIGFPQIFRADLSHPTTFLCPLGIALPLQSLHIPMKCFRHSAAPLGSLAPDRQRRGRGRSGSCVNFCRIGCLNNQWGTPTTKSHQSKSQSKSVIAAARLSAARMLPRV